MVSITIKIVPILRYVNYIYIIIVIIVTIIIYIYMSITHVVQNRTSIEGHSKQVLNVNNNE